MNPLSNENTNPGQRYFQMIQSGMSREAALLELDISTKEQASDMIASNAVIRSGMAETPTFGSFVKASLISFGKTANVGCTSQRKINTIYKDLKKVQNMAAQPTPAQQPTPCPA